VVWQEGPLLVCHSTLTQYLVVHNCKPKKSLQNFTSFVQPCDNNITVLRSTTNLQTLKELQSLEPSLKYHHNPTQKKKKKKQKGVRYKKEKNRKKVYP
jgi:hypothetical protein